MRASRLSLPVLAIALGVFSVQSLSAVTLYRLGASFTAVEKDSLARLGIEHVELPWSAFQEQAALDLAGADAGVLQPSYLDEDEDIAATLLDRGGKVWIHDFASENRLIGQVLLDGDANTDYTWSAIAPESFTSKSFTEKVTFDLGGRFLIREVRFRPRADRPDQFLESFSIGMADLGFDVYRIPVFTSIVDVKENTEPDYRIVLDPPVTTEALQLFIRRQTPKEIGLASFEVFGGGFVGRATYESQIVELPDLASWGEIRWSGRQDPRARIDIRTRSGTDPQPEVFWQSRPEQQDSVRFLQGGGDLSLTEYKRQYSRLSDILKPTEPLNRVSVDTDNWSFWSSPYDFHLPGLDIVSPGPRQYLQIRVDFDSTIDDGGFINYIEFEASVPPAVRGLIGEIAPALAPIGQATQFTYYIRPTIRPGDSSFDGVEIFTPSGVVSVDAVRIAGIDYSDFVASIHEDGRGFEVRLPRRLEVADSGALLEVAFTAPVFREVGTVFNGRIFDTTRPYEVRQRVAPGNAADEIEADELSVKTSLARSLLLPVEIRPNPFTPNGDGINDRTSISYKLLRLTSAVPVSIRIVDLSGRLMRRIFDGDDALGEHTHIWDGTDDSGRLVPPGLYLCLIEADIQLHRETTTALLCVAY